MSHFMIRDVEGKFVGRAHTSVAAHRATRRAGRLGASVNFANGYRRPWWIYSQWHVETVSNKPPDAGQWVPIYSTKTKKQAEVDAREWMARTGRAARVVPGPGHKSIRDKDVNRAGGRKKASTEMREHVLRVAAVDLMMGKRLEAHGPGKLVIYMGETTHPPVGLRGPVAYWYEHTGGRTYKETPEEVLVAVLPHVGINAIEGAVRHAR